MVGQASDGEGGLEEEDSTPPTPNLQPASLMAADTVLSLTTFQTKPPVPGEKEMLPHPHQDHPGVEGHPALKTIPALKEKRGCVTYLKNRQMQTRGGGGGGQNPTTPSLRQWPTSPTLGVWKRATFAVSTAARQVLSELNTQAAPSSTR